MTSRAKNTSIASERASVGASSSSSTSTNVSSSTLAKLAFFTIAMICFPIGTYFVTVDRYFDGNATYAGISAAVMANVVLFAYVLVAVMEDSQASRPSIKKQQ
ncbi:vacuolar ATPase assembly integral membrane protein vma21 [Mortierella polycephala]|uniref:Vacuolar ATPase assembly integral membrane protein vma21 n=1 Tax=Mortierella polycephala TaxID=41804 RepID=A0A9P6PM53_9FUNG|nr:vacuolar ATPase assembly integral membrane protein vma21 [Mortierella polycephala]